MRNGKGFTLTELMVVIGISMLLMVWGMPAFSKWKQKHDVENQVLRLYSDLQLARLTAYSQKVVAGVWWGDEQEFTAYQVRTDGNSNGNINDSISSTGDAQVGATVSSKWTIKASVDQNSVSFDGRGFLSPDNPLTFSISSTTGASINCVAVSATRIIVGKLNAGTCSPQ
ncbi:MAG: GspH/FimT family pseudopilin [Desulfobacteraceae bacterium]|nr:GspH/FimT family pseudopilin [Desulfobacteraceae bacterium]